MVLPTFVAQQFCCYLFKSFPYDLLQILNKKYKKIIHSSVFYINFYNIGDLGNIFVTDDGAETYNVDIADNLAKLSGGVDSVFGRAIVIHAGKDDYGRGGDAGSLKTGNAGGRLACCVIAVAK